MVEEKAEQSEVQPETITFDLIRKIQREEQRQPKLVKLPAGFYNNVQTYLERKRDASNRRVALEAKNVERLVKDIFNRRERKIFNLSLITARTDIPPENLTDEEKVFFDKVVEMLKARREELLEPLLEEDAKKETETLVVFSEDVPAFMGSDMKTYGPFKKGDITKLPEDNMRVMVERGIVKEFKIEK